ncbi:sigma-54-dependent transcriptional regulator [Thalassolituus oleivorans]|uniref:sigma-54-dependent transcriptional regulator n=1 Tax=Thalassolituus oleivorans TaxID=187493 RepID=UPI00042DC68A|nr:sigma-54 dependent transcriptional regulator [Thalassolituus oleivorans]AHK15056.1 chemotaxis protein CheY [Thalassolituus oleivorans R6-15]
MQAVHTALIVDDEPDIRRLIALTLERMGLVCYQAENVSEALTSLEERQYHFCITDMKLPDGDGLELTQLCNRKYPDMPIAMITAYGNMDLAVNALKSGAFDFVAKPIDTERLRQLVKAALQLTRVPTTGVVPATELLGSTPCMLALKDKIRKVARTQAPVFVYGESGTGKELVAQLIHCQSARADKPFIAVNCGAIPTELMESEFFGHTKGSFTGATSNKNGFFKAADGGTLFLDEIAELPLDLQAKLLRVVQEKTVRSVGSENEEHIDVRIITASHDDLATMVSNHQFRQDLYFRLNVIQLDVPRLSERKDDIEELTHHFITKYANEWSMPSTKLSEEALAALLEYSFPGNVRELENILQRAFTMMEGDIIRLDDLYFPANIAAELDSATDDAPKEHAPIATNNLEGYLENIEKRAIEEALLATRWNKTAAAEKLGISFRALRYRCKKLGID